MPIQIGKDGFSLPLEQVASTQAVVARKRKATQHEFRRTSRRG